MSKRVDFNTDKEVSRILSEASAKSKKSESWYNTSWVWVWLFLVWPVGVYGLIKRNSK